MDPRKHFQRLKNHPISYLCNFPSYIKRLPGQFYVNHRFQVTSFGGSGTSMIYGYLKGAGLNVPSTPDQRPWKHQSSPPSDSKVPRGFRALYLYSDPRNAVLSVFRRHYQHYHHERMKNRSNLRENLDLKSYSINEFLDLDNDPFEMENQFDNWTQSKREYPILILNYDSLWERLSEVISFFGIPSEYADHFPEQRNRSSNWKNLSDRLKYKINCTYKSLINKVKSAPNFEIV